MAITYARFQQYLSAIAAAANLDVANSGHGAFWNIPYQSFKSGTVPSKQCNGTPVPLLDPVNKLDSAFYKILQGGWCNMPEMPRTGPFVTDDGYLVALPDGTQITGKQILLDIESWLKAGAPEHG